MSILNSPFNHTAGQSTEIYSYEMCEAVEKIQLNVGAAEKKKGRENGCSEVQNRDEC